MRKQEEENGIKMVSEKKKDSEELKKKRNIRNSEMKQIILGVKR